MSSRYKCVEVIVTISGGEKLKTADPNVLNVANIMTPSLNYIEVQNYLFGINVLINS